MRFSFALASKCHEHLATSQDGRRGQFGDDQEHGASGLLRRWIDRAQRYDAILTIQYPPRPGVASLIRPKKELVAA